MRFSIEHESRYRFRQAARRSVQYLRLTPRADHSQSVLDWHVAVPGSVLHWRDGFNNSCITSVQNDMHEDLVVQVSGVVETLETNGVLPATDGLPPEIFVRQTPYTEVKGGIADLAADIAPIVAEQGTLYALHALMAAIGERVRYETGRTSVESHAWEALEHGGGVCQDHAHLFIACCLALRIPARYVSGYLHAGHGEHASHAWAEAFVADLGWVSFDVSNGQCATEAYVRLAVGFDYASAAPIRGVRIGGGEEELHVKVQVNHDG